jgi:hypothetical protein
MALPTSGTYNSLSLTAEVLIREAFENIGIAPEFRDALKMNSAIRSTTFLLQEWMSKGYNLWTVESAFFPITTGQAIYKLPSYVNDIVEMNTRTFTRQSNGIQTSFTLNTGGVVGINSAQSNTTTSYDNNNPPGVGDRVFNGNPAIGNVTQNTLNGNISFTKGGGAFFTVQSVGIISRANRRYTLVIEYCSLEDPDVPNNWTNLLTIPAQMFNDNELKTFVIPNPRPAVYYRVRETGGAILSLRQIYLNTGVAANAFDGNIYTSCTQQQRNGIIKCDYTNGGINPNTTNIITSVAIQSKTDQNYTLTVSGQIIDVADNPQTVILATLAKQLYPAGIAQWFSITIPANVTYIQIQETGGATLDIQELYFVNNETDIVMSNISYYEYQTMPVKSTQSRPTCYNLNRQFDNPQLILWPTPNPSYTLLYYSYTKMIQDISSLSQTIQIPARFYTALIWGLSYRLAVKYRPDLVQGLKSEYEEAFNVAAIEDSEDIPFVIEVDGGY